MSPIHQKPNSCNTQRVYSESSGFMPSFSYCFLVSNGIGAVCRAYASGNNYMVALVSFLYAAYLLQEWCFNVYQRLPPHQESPKKFFLKVAIWVLTTALFFGLVSQCTPYFCLPAYAVAIASSACIFYVYFICDDRNGSDEKIRSSQYYSLVEETSDKTLEHSVSILDRV